MRSLCTTISLLLVTLSALADSPLPNKSHEVRSANGKFAITMSPVKHFGFEGTSKVARVNGRSRTQIWSVPQFFHQAFLANSGQHAAQIGPWAEDQKNLSDLAIAFYKGGRLLRKYQVLDLIDDPKKVEMSVSHYEWLAAKQSKPNGYDPESKRFHLVLSDKSIVTFDSETGKIVGRGTDQQALTDIEILERELIEMEAQAEKFSRSSAALQEIEKSFTLSRLRVGWGYIGLPGDGKWWSGHFEPKKPFSFPTVVNGNFRLAKDGAITVTFTANQLRAALQLALAHPKVANAAAAAEPGSCLFLTVAGERMSDTNLDRPLAILAHHKLKQGKPDGWMQFQIESRKGRDIWQCWLHTDTGQLIIQEGLVSDTLLVVDKNGSERRLSTEIDPLEPE